MQTLPNIQHQLSSKDLFDAFKVQLAKDFSQSNFPADFAATLEPDYNSIRETLALELQHNEKQTNLMQLLYRVDIGEVQLKKYLHQHKNENRFDAMAGLIIKRILQKVVIRQYYKNKL